MSQGKLRARCRGLAAGSSWTPASLSNLDFWAEADSGVSTDVDGIYQWNDLSGNGRHAVQATGSKKPQLITAAQNGLDVVRLDAIDDCMNFPSITTTSSDWSLIIAYDETGSGVRDYILDSDGADRIVFASRAVGTGSGYWAGSWNEDASAQPGGEQILEFLLSVGNPSVRRNGVELLTGTYAQDGLSGTIRLFSNQGGISFFLEADVFAVILCRERISDADATLLRTYLSDKWGITI